MSKPSQEDTVTEMESQRRANARAGLRVAMVHVVDGMFSFAAALPRDGVLSAWEKQRGFRSLAGHLDYAMKRAGVIER